jgi:ATP-dependent Clp protease ATP-binding subunit ClpX
MRRRNAYCSFCRKSHRDVGLLVEGPGDVYICGECVDLCGSIILQEKRRREFAAGRTSAPLTAEELRARLDPLIGGQEEAKDALIGVALGREQGSAWALLVGPSRGTNILLARAVAHALAAPFAAGDAADLAPSGSGREPVVPLLYDLLRDADFDLEAAGRGVVYADGMDQPQAQEAALRLWQGRVQHVMDGLRFDVHHILLACGGQFAGLDEAVARTGRHPEQPLTDSDLLAAGARPEWVRQLRAMVRTSPLDEATLARMATWVDFRRADDPARHGGHHPAGDQ